MLASTITSVAGASKTLKFGLVVYSNESKTKILKIPKKIINKYGAVSEKVCLSMLKNVSKIGRTSMSISITGIAGPHGGSKKKPVGLVFIGIKKKNKFILKKYLFKNKGRFYIQKSAVSKSLNLILSMVK